MLKQRLITAAILIPITLFILFYSSQPTFFKVTGVIVGWAAFEWTYLMQIKRAFVRAIYVLLVMLAMIGVSLSLIMNPYSVPLFFAITFFWWLLALILVLIYPRGRSFWAGNKIVKGIMGVLVLVPCWVGVNYIRGGYQGIYVLAFVFALIWGADTAAYFAGRKWGTTKLAPLVSPGKSIQGVIGALIYTVVLTMIVAVLSKPPVAIIISAVVLAVVTVLFSILGDLFESMLKREAGLKDSSNILPGHGGILDRIDSLTAAAPVYAFGGLLLSMFFS